MTADNVNDDDQQEHKACTQGEYGNHVNIE